MGEDDDENIAGGRAGGGHRRRLVPALVLVACVLLGQACICDAQLSPSSDIATVRRDEGGECLFIFISNGFLFLEFKCKFIVYSEIRWVEFLPRSSLAAFIKSGDFTRFANWCCTMKINHRPGSLPTRFELNKIKTKTLLVQYQNQREAAHAHCIIRLCFSL